MRLHRPLLRSVAVTALLCALPELALPATPGILPPPLEEALQLAMVTPYHFRVEVRSPSLPISAQSEGAVDLPAKTATVHALVHLLPGIRIRVESMTIDGQVWYRTDPPGGPFRVQSVDIPAPKAIPWQDLAPYLQDVQTEGLELRDGRPCLGYAFRLSPAGIAELNRGDASLPLGRIEQASGRVWAAETAPHYLCAARLEEQATQGGLPFLLEESIDYDRWGEALHVQPPPA